MLLRHENPNKEQRPMGIFQTNVKILNTFLHHFQSVFSQKQFAVLKFFFYALFKDYKRCSIQVLAEKSNTDYQKFQYFISEAKWSVDDLTSARIKLLQAQKSTASSKNGILIIDDSANPKPFSKKTEGARYQHCGVLKREEICNVFVASCFASLNKYFPLNIKFYKPESEFTLGKNDPRFQSKIQLASNLIREALQFSVSFDTVLLDAWYAAKVLLEFIHNLKKTFITELKDTRNLLFYHPGLKKHALLRVDEIVTLVQKFYRHKFKPVSLKNPDGLSHRRWTYSFKSTLKDCSIPVNVVIMFGQWDKNDDASYHVFITNDSSLSAHAVISTYTRRWCIERVFRELKDSFALDQYQVRSKTSIERYWHLCLLAWTCIYWIKQNAYLSKIITNSSSLKTFNDFKHAIASLIDYSSVSLLSRSQTIKTTAFCVKSQRFINSCANAA